jgi:RNA polymerase sigma-70 factor (ECF subfamily)
VYLRYQDQVGRWAQRLWGAGDVEDIVQEVFLTVWREEAKIGALERRDATGDPLERWLYRVTEHAVYNHRWRERWRRRVARSTDADRTLAQVPSDAPSALDLMHRAEASVDVYDVLNRLGERYRTVLILFELEELSGEEIAALTGTKLATVWVRLHRARAKFLQVLEKLAPTGRLREGRHA